MLLKIKGRNILFYLAYGIYIMALVTDKLAVENTHTAKQILVLVSVALLCCDYIKKYFTGHSLSMKITFFGLLLTILTVIVCYMALTTNDYYLTAVIMFALGLRELDIEEFFQVSLVILALITICVVLSSIIGLIPMLQWQRSTVYNHGARRFGMGFSGGGYLPNIIVYCACYYYSFKKKVRIADFLLFQLFGVSVFFLCNSRNGLIALEIMFLMLLFWQKSKKTERLKKIIRIAASLSFSLMAILSIYLLYAYKFQISFSVRMNEILSDRLRVAMMNSFASPFEWIHFETSAHFMEKLTYAYDNGYYFMIARYGYLMLILLCVMVTFICRYMKNQNDYTAILGLFVVALLNFIDNGLISYGFFPYMLIGIYSMFHHSVHYIKTRKKRSTSKIYYGRIKI